MISLASFFPIIRPSTLQKTSGPESALRLAPFYDLLSTAVYPIVERRLAMQVNGRSDPGQITGKDWRTLARGIGVGSYLEDTVRELAEELPRKARQLALDLKTEHSRMTIIEPIFKIIRQRARRADQLLKN